MENSKDLNGYIVHTIGGASLSIKAHHFSVNESANRIEFFLTETDNDPRWTIFLHGVAAIEQRETRELTQW